MGPVRVPLGDITKLIMANMEPIKANRIANETLVSVKSHSLKSTSSAWLPTELSLVNGADTKLFVCV